MKIKSIFYPLLFISFLLGTSAFAAKSENNVLTGFNELHIAAYKGYDTVVEMLINSFPALATQVIKKDSNAKYKGFTVLHIAVERGHIRVVDVLVKKLVKMSKKTAKEDKKSWLLHDLPRKVVEGNNEGWNSYNALHIAVLHSDVPICKILLKHYPELAAEVLENRGGAYTGYNALHLGANKGYTAVFKNFKKNTMNILLHSG